MTRPFPAAQLAAMQALLAELEAAKKANAKAQAAGQPSADDRAKELERRAGELDQKVQQLLDRLEK